MGYSRFPSLFLSLVCCKVDMDVEYVSYLSESTLIILFLANHLHCCMLHKLDLDVSNAAKILGTYPIPVKNQILVWSLQQFTVIHSIVNLDIAKPGCLFFTMQSMLVFFNPIKFGIAFTLGNLLAIGRYVFISFSIYFYNIYYI